MREARGWVRIVRCSDIPLREGRAVTVGDREIAIFNLGDRFLAVDNRCPHKGGPLADGIVSGSTVVCPLHAWKMNLETGKGDDGVSATSCVETFRTRVEDGVVLLELSDEHTASDEVHNRGVPDICQEASEIAAMNGYPSAAEA